MSDNRLKTNWNFLRNSSVFRASRKLRNENVLGFYHRGERDIPRTRQQKNRFGRNRRCDSGMHKLERIPRRREEGEGGWCVGRGVLCWNNLSSGGLYPAAAAESGENRANWREKQQRFAAMVRPSCSHVQFGREISGMVPGRARDDAGFRLNFRNFPGKLNGRPV